MNENVLGIDIGSVSIGVAKVGLDGRIIESAYGFHHGDIEQSLISLLEGFDLSKISYIATTSSTPRSILSQSSYDDRIALITAARHIHGGPGAVLNVGGEKFSLILFDDDGNYRACKTNSSCAAGTGSFLDQQAIRLNCSGSAELSRLALNNKGAIPKIASRCAVFAKTDIIHAQQEGFTLPEICDGLCEGLGRNIVDTLFSGEDIKGSVVFCGGVSKNEAVRGHITSLIDKELIVDECSHIYGAVGSALCLIREGYDGERINVENPRDLILDKGHEVKSYYEPLELKLSDYPDFKGIVRYDYQPQGNNNTGIVEVDIYEPLDDKDTIDVYLGIDIGSTSTKAVLMDSCKRVVSGIYTRTAGRPVSAICAVLETIDDLSSRNGIALRFLGSGTTGSGRKLIGSIIRADMILDEITAHARAACELNPDVDTIIEIGGQDAKFTTLKDSMVTFSAMNTVCAAGTGSFIEEQAQKLGCPLEEYSLRTQGKASPVSSDRCTVFMERDMNHYLNEGYSVDEVLASALHSVRENYLTKVATEASIGDTIFFQGATAKNKSLVAAFEQRLGKPILVSKYCHLTGALGTALTLADQCVRDSSFRGLDIYKKDIPVTSEVCDLCTNHCKITIAEIDGDKVAYGFLCGRDYNTDRFVDNNASGFDLIKQRKQAFSFKRPKRYRQDITIGIPAGLHLFEDIPFWQYFFDMLSIRTITSGNFRDSVKEGKRIAGAEFCAPLTSLYGHAHYLLDKADYVFLPIYLEDKDVEKGLRRQYCYYTQYSSSLISAVGNPEERKRFLTPLVNYIYSRMHTKAQLYKMLRDVTDGGISLFDVSKAFDKATEHKQKGLEQLKRVYKVHSQVDDDISIVLLGRPYTVLNKGMNNGIIDMFASKGIKTFYQDMIDVGTRDVSGIRYLINDIHWKYAANILEAAESVAGRKGVYPVFVTSFRCSPDSFVAEYLKKVMDSHNKPYLILQLDEHDSNVGYETRIEAAIRSFRNHNSSGKSKVPHPFLPICPKKSLEGKIVLYPNWDSLSCAFNVANLRREGIDARLLEESAASMQKSLRYNTGQCIPINVMAQEYIDYMEKYDLDPAKCILWLSTGELACNLKLIPHHIKSILNEHGGGIEKAQVYQGDMGFQDISLAASINGYFSYMFGGLLRRLGCKIRPYEIEKGQTDKVIKESAELLSDAFLGLISKEDAVKVVVSRFEKIRVRQEKRPKVAIFGDLFVRDNDFFNQDLITFIEENGGEVITTPYNTYAKMIAGPYIKKWVKEGKYLYSISSKAILATLTRMEKRYYRYFQRLLNEPDHEYNDSVEDILGQYNLIPEHTGESMDNILKIHYIKKYYPDVALFLQTSPAFCCPGLVTEAMMKNIEKNTGVPVVTITYDGTCSNKNTSIIPYLKYPRKVEFSEEGFMQGGSLIS